MPSLVWCYAKMVKKPSLNDEKLMKLATIALHCTIGLKWWAIHLSCVI